MTGKFHFFENQLDICLEVSIDFKHDLGIESGGGGASYNGQSRGGSGREGYIFRLQVYERVAISLIKVHESLGKPVIFVC